MTNEQVIAECESYIAGQYRYISEIQAGQWDERCKMFGISRGQLAHFSEAHIAGARTTISDARQNALVVCRECGRGRSINVACWSCGYPS